ncbi:thioredoxin [Sulfurivermis fontis]|uniref:thioredoxin n=1 Tax=Sulfurivermis fontis TaxID=1972068 RepID=UPI000FD6FF1F|nr:thioredoxin [Sulfurivermis fontis]
MSNSAHIIEVTAENFAAVVDRSMQVPVLVDFWAAWCQPCKALLPIVEKLAAEYQGRFLLAKVNIDEQQALANQFGVRSVPTVKLIRDGRIVDEFSGALPESQVRAFLDKHMEQPADKYLAAAEQAWQSGDTVQAEAILRQVMREIPEDRRAQLMLAELLAIGGNTDEASQLLASLPADVALSPQAEALRARLSFTAAATGAPDIDTLQQMLTANPQDSQARYQLAARLVLAGDPEGALEQLLELLRRDRSWGDDAGRKGMLQIFDLLGGQGDLVNRYRRLMFTAMH